jgi:hypothetical protein
MSNEWDLDGALEAFTRSVFPLLSLSVLLCDSASANLSADDLLSVTGHDRALRSVGATRATSLFSSSAREIPNVFFRGSRRWWWWW